MSDSEFNCTPPEVREAADTAVAGIIPVKSRERYEKNFTEYSKWCAVKGVQHTSETVLLGYFAELSKKFKSSTLWSRYSMLRAVINIKQNIDISQYPKLRGFLKRQNTGYKAKKSNVLSEENVRTFLNTAPEEDLVIKVIFILFYYSYQLCMFKLLGCFNSGHIWRMQMR